MTLFKPWPHQLMTADVCSQVANVFDMSDPGTGKTSAHLLAYDRRKQAGDAKRALVVCPKTLMRSAWANEIEQYFPHLTYSIADAANREEAFKFKTDIVVVNTDGVKDLAPKKNKRYRVRNDLFSGFTDLIIDESTTFKHTSSARSGSMRRLAKLFDNRYLLTGTPNSNSITDLWHQMLILDRGERLGDVWFHFRNSVQICDPFSHKWVDRPEAVDAVFSLIKDVTIRHAFEDVMTHVPANHVSRYDFDLKPSTLKLYRQLEDSSVLQLSDGAITAVHAASLRNKLLQLASGAVYTEDGHYSVIDTQRYELGAELVEQHQHSVMFFVWRHQREQMALHLSKRNVPFAVIDGTVPQRERDQIVADFQSGRYQTVLLHPQTGAHGLTLTLGEACILLSPIYEADLLKQAIHRIYRGSQDKVTNTVLVQARGTVEDLVYERRNQKTQNMNDFLSLVVQAQARRS